MITIVGSSNISEVGYNDEESILFVKFKTGSTYRYFDVPREEYDKMMAAPSVGLYFKDHIKHAYKYAR